MAWHSPESSCRTGYAVVSSDEHCRVPQLQPGAAGGQSSWRELLQRFWDELEQTTASASACDRMEVQAALDAALGPLIFPPQVATLVCMSSTPLSSRINVMLHLTRRAAGHLPHLLRSQRSFTAAREASTLAESRLSLNISTCSQTHT